MSKKIVLSGYFGFKNFGDEVILALLINKLKEQNTQICVITSNPEYTASLHNDVMCVKTFDLKSIIYQIITTDVLISGGGSLLQDVTSIKSLFYYLAIITFGLLFRKKVIIFAQGIGPIKSKVGQFITKLILKKCTSISVRDQKSHDLLNNWGIKSEIVCDPVFSAKIIPAEKKHRVGVQIRSFHNLSDKFICNLAEKIINHFNGYEIEIISLQDSLDLEVCNKLEQKIKEISMGTSVNVHANLTFAETIDLINSCEYFIGMRFHSLIVSLLSKVKTLGINYDIKVQKLAEEYDFPLINPQDEISMQSIEELIRQDINTVHSKVARTEFDWSVLTKNI